jgi:BTB/POZ domain
MELFCGFSLTNDGYGCFIKKASIIQPSTEVRAVHGEHEFGLKTYLKNADVTVLYFQNTVMNYVPKGLNIIFPKLREVRIISCGLKTISREDFIDFEGLEVLYIVLNDMTSLPDDLFDKKPKLREVSFEHNKIEYMSSDLLKPIIHNRLEFVDFRRNKRIDACFSMEYCIPSIKDFKNNLSVNKIKQLDSNRHRSPTENLLINYQRKSSEGFLNLWSTGKFSDFVIVCGSKEFRVHKCILATHSKVFEEMFEKDESSTKMKIEDLSAEAVEEFLRYFYTGKFANKTENSTEIFSLVTKFEITEIKTAIEEIILSELTDSNAFKIFTLGHSFASDELKRAAFEKIKTMYSHIEFPDGLIDDLQAVQKTLKRKKKLRK